MVGRKMVVAYSSSGKKHINPYLDPRVIVHNLICGDHVKHKRVFKCGTINVIKKLAENIKLKSEREQQ